MEVQAVFILIAIIGTGAAVLIVDRLRSKRRKRTNPQVHRPHSPSYGHSEANRLQNGGTIGPGKLGGGADFGPS